jgi:hypothetical protein
MKSRRVLACALIITALLANAALAVLFSPPPAIEYKFPSGQYSLLVSNNPTCRIVLKELVQGTESLLFEEKYICDTRVYPSPNRKNLIMEIRGNSTDIILCVFKEDKGRPQLVDCICPPRCDYQLQDMYAAFPDYVKKISLIEKALTGYPKDVDYMHVYCAFIEWIDDRRARLNVTMYTPAKKYYELNNTKVLAGIDRDFVYAVGN